MSVRQSAALQRDAMWHTSKHIHISEAKRVMNAIKPHRLHTRLIHLCDCSCVEMSQSDQRWKKDLHLWFWDPVNRCNKTSSLKLKIKSDPWLFQCSPELISLIGVSLVKGFWLGFNYMGNGSGRALSTEIHAIMNPIKWERLSYTADIIWVLNFTPKYYYWIIIIILYI